MLPTAYAASAQSKSLRFREPTTIAAAPRSAAIAPARRAFGSNAVVPFLVNAITSPAVRVYEREACEPNEFGKASSVKRDCYVQEGLKDREPQNTMLLRRYSMASRKATDVFVGVTWERRNI